MIMSQVCFTNSSKHFFIGCYCTDEISTFVQLYSFLPDSHLANQAFIEMKLYFVQLCQRLLVEVWILVKQLSRLVSDARLNLRPPSRHRFIVLTTKRITNLVYFMKIHSRYADSASSTEIKIQSCTTITSIPMETMSRNKSLYAFITILRIYKSFMEVYQTIHRTSKYFIINFSVDILFTTQYLDAGLFV